MGRLNSQVVLPNSIPTSFRRKGRCKGKSNSPLERGWGCVKEKNEKIFVRV